MCTAKRFFQGQPPAAVTYFIGDAHVADIGELGDLIGIIDGCFDTLDGILTVDHGTRAPFANLSTVLSQRFGFADRNIDPAEEAAVAGKVIEEFKDQFEIDRISELMGRFIFQMMGFINDHTIIFGKETSDFQILKEQ